MSNYRLYVLIFSFKWENYWMDTENVEDKNPGEKRENDAYEQ